MLEFIGHEVTTRIFLDKEKMQEQEQGLTPQDKYDLDLKWLLEADVLIGEIKDDISFSAKGEACQAIFLIFRTS